MTIELSNVTFTQQTDVIPAFGIEDIVNTGIANTLAGNDQISGTVEEGGVGIFNSGVGIFNRGNINSGDGNDSITGTGAVTDPGMFGIGIFNQGSGSSSPTSPVSINSGNGNDSIIGTGNAFGIFNWEDINTGSGNDTITGIGGSTGIKNYYYSPYYYPSSYYPRINTGDGNDEIIGTGVVAIENDGLISTGNGNDSIIANGYFQNYGGVSLGDGNDSIITTGNMHNGGTISAGKGNDSITVYGSFNREGYGLGVELGDGNDYFYGFGDGSGFNGESGTDTLELPPGSYTIEIPFTTVVTFTEDSTFISPSQKAIMYTSGFEKLIAGGTTYNFSSFTNGQTLVVT